MCGQDISEPTTGKTGYMHTKGILQAVSMSRPITEEAGGQRLICLGNIPGGGQCNCVRHIKSPAKPSLKFSPFYIFNGIFIFIPGRIFELSMLL